MKFKKLEHINKIYPCDARVRWIKNMLVNMGEIKKIDSSIKFA